MEVPDHLYYAGRQNAGRSDSFSKRSKNERNSLIDEMFVPDKITVGAGNILIPHHHQPNDILRDKPTLTPNSQVTLMPTKLTANEFPLQDTKQDKQIAEEAKKRADSQDSLLKNADSMNALNSSLAVDIDPIRELKSVRRAMGRLATRVLELEDENNRRQTREYGLWAIFTGNQAISVLMTGTFKCIVVISRRAIHGSSNGAFLKIGDVQVPIRTAKHPELVPRNFANPTLINQEIGNLKWMLQKEILKQDIFLNGPPGFLKSSLALAYCELTNREVEYLLLTRDSTESDVKQRREIRSGNAAYSDLSAVSAALNGRVLIIDGIEKAERNVLPILNNLLENREMQLEDGRFLINAKKYDKLVEKYGKEGVEKMKLERVSEDFAVIALGLPVPNFKGYPLDPPLRSRFQCVNIGYLPFGITKQLCESLTPNVNRDKLDKLLCLAYGINSQHGKDGLNLTRVPIENLVRAVSIWNQNPAMSESEIFSMVYPEKSILRRDTEQSTLEQFYQNFKIERPSKQLTAKLTQVEQQDDGTANLQLDYNGDSVQLNAWCGHESKHPHFHEYISTADFETFLAQITLTHSAGFDFCILGDKGSGKSTLVTEFARRLGYATETIALYNDLNSRDLLQMRRILPDGDTVWEDSQLLQSMKNGSLAILDNLEQAHHSTIEVLSTLIHHRFLQLPDGTRLVSSPAFEILKAKAQCSSEELNKRGVFKISPNFRIVALADADSANATGPTSKWLNDQLLSLFIFHTLPSMDSSQELQLISKLVPEADQKTAQKLIGFVQKLSSSHDAKVKNVALSLSLRKQIGILRRHASNKKEGIFEAIQRAILFNFLPKTTRAAILKYLQDFGIEPSSKKKLTSAELTKQLSSLKREDQSIEHEALVPEILFFENQQHIDVISDLAKDFALGSHLLLIGNQGVGKNKLTDKFLELCGLPRQYIQLHRDTTVQSLTIQTSVVDKVIRYEDSPLIKAVQNGQVLVVDEGDKAPLNVIAVLKSLLDSGILYLSDGRRIQPAELDPLPNGKSIPIHPNFRMIMLANRPGFPFLGNDLFSTLGDLFSVHIVDNPDQESEMAMLKQYGPNVDEMTIWKLVKSFNDLRALSNDGQLQYPFSTRELVGIVKHLQRFPNDPVELAVKNVFDFDAYSNDTLKTIESVFKEHKLAVELAKIYTTKERLEIQGGDNFDMNKLLDPKYGKVDPNNAPHSGGNTWAGGTGGYSTAGLGGVGGPFRLDAGHDVTQISELAKQQVPEEVKRKAREIAKQEYAKRLKEIDMSPHDGAAYKQIYDKISTQVGLMKNIIDSLEAREKERRWAKNQTTGDLDDNKLIEGMAGEKAIYRKRVELEPEPGSVQKKPKLLTLLVDVSGSMYRFNGYDQRLHKSLETVLLVMEALNEKSDKIKYNLVGHSGESFEVNFSSADKPPKNEKERLDILKKMLAHSQFCLSGDYTLEAIEVATKKLAKEENADERFLITLSDANLDRYGIRPKHLAEVMDLEKNVNSYLILIGSLGPQAERLRKEMPAGRAFIAQNTAELPQIMQEIFSSTLIQ